MFFFSKLKIIKEILLFSIFNCILVYNSDPINFFFLKKNKGFLVQNLVVSIN